MEINEKIHFKMILDYYDTNLNISKKIINSRYILIQILNTLLLLCWVYYAMNHIMAAKNSGIVDFLLIISCIIAFLLNLAVIAYITNRHIIKLIGIKKRNNPFSSAIRKEFKQFQINKIKEYFPELNDYYNCLKITTSAQKNNKVKNLKDIVELVLIGGFILAIISKLFDYYLNNVLVKDKFLQFAYALGILSLFIIYFYFMFLRFLKDFINLKYYKNKMIIQLLEEIQEDIYTIEWKKERIKTSNSEI